MKLILLAAAAAIAVPAVAQTTTDTQTDTTATAPDATQDTTTDTTTAPDQSMSTTTSTSTMAAPDASAAEQAGGYAPTAPAMSQPATPGATVTFQPSASPEQAFPPPAPLAHYPICKRGQTDKCMEPGGGRK